MKTAPIIFTLAWRNLWRNYRRTLIMIGAVAVGVWAMMFMNALMRGMVDEMVHNAVLGLPGHVQIHHPEYQDDPSVVNSIGKPDGALLNVLEADNIVAWTSRVKVPAVISSERESRGITLIGIDPDTEAEISFIKQDLAEGRYLESTADKGVLIGRKLAEKLETALGKRIVIMSQDPDNEIVDRGFRIVGIFDTSLESYEEMYVFAGLETTQKLLRIGDEVQEIAVLGQDFRTTGALFGGIAAVASTDLSVEPWYELDTYLGTMLEVMDGFVLIWIVVIFLALSFGLVNTLVMAVFERVREIGLMLALGMKPYVILGQIIVESLLLLMVGLLIGNGLVWLTVVPLESGIDISSVAQGMEIIGASAVLYPSLKLDDVIMANVIVLALGVVASLSPAWRASRYEPIEAITKV
jgi:ABC-type lipoprotein release transport system permease subunit